MFRRNAKQSTFSSFLFALILITLSNDNIASETAWKERWNNTLAPLKYLNSSERKAVVISIRGRVNINYNETVAHNLKSDKPEDTLWGMKVFARTNVLMSRLSKYIQWGTLEIYYNYETDYIVQLIQGKVDWNLYLKNAESNQIRLDGALDEIKLSRSELEKISNKNIKIVDSISTFIIGDAKLHALD